MTRSPLPLAAPASGAVVLVGALLLRMPVAYAIAAGLVPVAALLVRGAHCAPAQDGPPIPGRQHADGEGGRRELDRLAWSLSGAGGAVSEEALRLLRPVAEQRLRRVGVDLARPDGAQRARELLGERAWATLTCPGGTLPRVRDLEHTVSALEALVPPGPGPVPPAAAPGSRT
ncbi:hypothetical protein CLV35_1970 [Motilibacter peucedani]|uniref:Uncharacterized protein n=1 Tax=Motilibacter peucedani TaxID=598650 RepID=A0A420XQF8_9ACTN|nr:hypothetical protein [Motilibacter peucedani]RKS75500.1 hypothetical protein CLV35_1970 [Motilibacter peucedani]